MHTHKKFRRKLRGYSLDPSFSTRLDTMGVNEITYDIRWENVEKGPIGEYFEVIDNDPASNCFYDPVDLNALEVLAQNGLAASEGNPQFHQQFVYTIAMKTLEHFEKSLGRKIIWLPRIVNDKNSRSGIREEYVHKLRLHPHAFRKANAYYDKEVKAVLFGYFKSTGENNGITLPGGVVFTCLSPDVVAHELTHALLDSIHPRFSENTNCDAAAFHEGFADVVALLQRFAIPTLLEHQIAKTKGNLGDNSFLGELAIQVGNGLLHGGGALRSAIGQINPATGAWEKFKPDPQLYPNTFEPHKRGAILVSTIFDAFIRLYNSRTEDLIRIATNGSGILQPGAIHPDLVKRLAAEASEIAQHLLHICIRALDYCPPVDITFGDYLRALITADIDAAPMDDNGYRIALIEAFRSWGIYPDRVNTISEESLCWGKPDNFTSEEKTALKFIAQRLKQWVKPIAELSGEDKDNRKLIYDLSREAQAQLHDILIGKKQRIFGPRAWAKFLQKFGLTYQPIQFEYAGEKYSSQTAPLIEVHNIRPIIRIGREGTIVEQVLVTITQTFRANKGDLADAKFRGGCTLILNISNNYDVEYIIYKNIQNQERFTQQMDFQLGKTKDFQAHTESLYDDGSGFAPLNFADIHSH